MHGDFPDPADLGLDETMDAFLSPDAMGETLTIYNESYAGSHPKSGNAEWTEDDPVVTHGRVVERSQPTTVDAVDGEPVEARYDLNFPTGTPVYDGRAGDQQRASEVEDESGARYRVVVVDPGPTIRRCIAELMN